MHGYLGLSSSNSNSSNENQQNSSSFAGQSNSSKSNSSKGSSAKKNFSRGTVRAGPDCTHGGVEETFITDGGVIVQGTGSRKGQGWQSLMPDEQPDLVIGPKGQIDPPTVVGFNFTDMTDDFPDRMVGLKWRDGSIPNVTSQFWHDLAQEIRTNDDIEVVQAQCMGGHGRTGTALAILAGLLLDAGFDDVSDVLEFVRDSYCKRAVESKSQIEHISTVLDLDIGSASGSKEFARGRSKGGFSTAHKSKQSAFAPDSPYAVDDDDEEGYEQYMASLEAVDDALIERFERWGYVFGEQEPANSSDYLTMAHEDGQEGARRFYTADALQTYLESVLDASD